MNLQLVFDALSLGGIYATAALGVALIFGVMQLVNFAQAQFLAFCVFALIVPSRDAVAVMGLGAAPAWVLIPAVLAIGVGLAVLSEFLVFRRLRNAEPVSLMVASFSLGVVIQNLLLMVYGGRPKAVSLWPNLGQPVEFLGAAVPLLQLIVIFTIIVMLIALSLLLKFTRIGLEMRAAAENFGMARLLGVRANRVIMMAFGVSGLLAAMLALIFVAQTGVADVRMGGSLVLIAFVATVLGGMGSLSGAVVAGLVLGAVSTLLQAYLPVELRPFRDAFVYGLVIVVLLVRPQGLFTLSSVSNRI
ncbi:MAG: branched-chain amino acid ABC transporter permease [Rhodobacterales bacterium]|nr:MAG: branched-chain amino acid ABC transporter permease [Rhodobacterales bacterium]